jgi:hypothetical protein
MKITVAPSSGSYVDSAGMKVDFRIDNVGHLGEKGYEKLRGAISMNGGAWVEIGADAYKSRPTYSVFTGSWQDEQNLEQDDTSHAELLAVAVEEVVRREARLHNLPYVEYEGPRMDLSIENNVATGR